MAAKKQLLLDRLGGEEALELAVDKFYEKNVADEELAKYFEGVDMKKLRTHQFKFMKLAFTEIPEGTDIVGMLERVHGRLFDMGLNEKHFDLVAGNLVAALQELGVASNLIDDAVAVVGPLRGVFEDQAKKRVEEAEKPKPATREAKKQLLLDRLGGEAALELAVDKFYDKNVANEELAKYFEGVDMKRLRAHQFKFMKLAFTEIPEGTDIVGMLERVHGRLFDMGLNEKHFDLVAGNLVAALQELGVASNLIDDAVAVVAPLRIVFEDQAKARVESAA
jgi:hemoglobin